MSVQGVDYVALTPVLLVAGAALVVLVLQAFRPGRRIALDAVTIGGLMAGLLATVWLSTRAAPRSTFCAAPDGDLLGRCSYQVTSLTLSLQFVVLLAAVVVVLIAADGPSASGRLTRAEHHHLLLAAVAGALVLAGARDLITLVVALETASLPLVGLIGLRRDRDAARAATTLLLVAVTSLGLALVGVALLYTATESLYLAEIAAFTAVASPDPGGGLLVALGTMLVVAGIGYKVAALPFGLWVGDVYAGSPVAVAAFLSTVSKVAGVAAILLVLLSAVPGDVATWGPWLSVVVLATMTVGNLIALAQSSPLRLLAWSTVAQAGWVLLALLGAGRSIAITPSTAAVTYLLVYTVATLVAFAVVVLVARHHPSGSLHGLGAYRGLVRREPVAAGLLALALLTLAGLPPGTAGLVAKLAVLAPVLDAGRWWVAVLAGLNVALGLAYYLRWLVLLVLARSDQGPTWSLRPAEGAALGLSGIALIALSMFPALLSALA